MVASLASALLFGEVLARVTWRPPETPRPPPSPAGLPELKTSFELSRPRVEGIYKGAYYRTNARGVRGPEYELPKPPGVFRIVIAGDSVTMGDGVREEDAYPHVLQDALDRRPGPPRYEVLNLGLIGLDVRQVMGRLRNIGLFYEPDLLVYGCTLNDIQGPHYRRSMGPWAAIQLRARYTRFAESPSYLLRVMWPRWQSLADLVAPSPGTYFYELRDNYLYNAPAWDDFTAGLDTFAHIANGRHVRGIVFVHAMLDHLDVFHPYRRIYARIADAAEARGLRVIQSFPALRGHDALTLWIGPIDGHPNAEGHRLLAQALLDGLDRLPADDWRPAEKPSSTRP